MIQMKKTFLNSFLSAVAVFTLVSCEKETDKPLTKGESVQYAMAVTGGTYPSQTSYFMGFEQFPTGSVGTANAAEMQSSAMMFSYGGFHYISNFGTPATLRKFGFDDATGKPQELGSFIVQGLKTFGAIDFISATEAYAASNGFGGVPKLIKFNPTTMQITGTVDLSPLQKAAAKEVFYLGMAHRDNQLFMGVNYQTASFSNVGDSVYVAMINRTTDKVEKLIADGRTSMIWASGPASGFGGSSLFIDENKDVYVNGTGNGGSVPSGIVRIKNGQSTFDKDYFFDMNKALGSDAYGVHYYGNGKALTLKSDDPNNYPFDDSKAAGYRFFKIDLAAKTSQGELSATLPKVFSSAFSKKWDDKLYLSAPTPQTNAIYSFDIASGAVKKEFDVAAGECNGFVKFK
jgi:hypothetical protein